MQRSTGGASFASFTRGIPIATSSTSAYVTMRDLPAGTSHAYVTSDDHRDTREGRKRAGKRVSVVTIHGGAEGGRKERSAGGVGARGGGGLERGVEWGPQSTQHAPPPPPPPHWCLQSLHTSPESVANGDEPQHPSDLMNSSGHPRNDIPGLIHFPWTLDSHYAASGSRLPPATSVVIDDPGVYGRRINQGQGQQRSRPGGHRCRRSGSGLSSPSSASNSSVDRLRPSPATDDSRPGSHQKVLLSSPFESTLTQLRLDRLRIEEEHLLEIKRQEELERIRGPRPKWYALKSSEFGRELRRHNDLLKTSDGGRDEGDYRDTLERASQHFQQAYYSEAQ